MKPVAIDFQPQTWSDPETGRKVTRLFPVGQNASHAYFTSTSFDGRGDLNLSAECGGRMQLCRVDLKAGKAWQLTDFEAMRPQGYCVCPAGDFAVVKDGERLVIVDLSSGETTPVYEPPEGWHIGPGPTVDAAGSRVAFSLTEEKPTFAKPSKSRLSQRRAEGFYYRRAGVSLIACLDMEVQDVVIVWGEPANVSHVLVNPVDPDTIVFCHEGGSLVQHRLWVVDARPQRKKTSRCLYEETVDEHLAHEYFVSDGTLGVQRMWYDPGTPREHMGPCPHASILFLSMTGEKVAEYFLPGRASGHVQSNADNSLIVADGYFTGDPKRDRDGRSYLAFNIPDGDTVRVEKICRHDSSWRSQLSHPHPIFSPDEKFVLFSSDAGGTNSAFVVEI